MSKLYVKKYLLRICYLLVLINNCLVAQEARQIVPPRCRETRRAQKRFFRDIRRGDCDLVGTLEDHPSLVHARNENQQTPLHVVAHRPAMNSVDIAKILLKYGAQVDAVDHCAHTPLLLALFAVNDEIVKLLVLNGACVNGRLPTGQTLLHWFLLGQHPFQDGQFFDILNAGADVDARNSAGETPLNLAVQTRCEPRRILGLLRHGARVNVSDINGDMPLHIAAARGDIDLLKALIKHRAAADARNRSNETALHIVVSPLSNQDRQRRMIEALVAAGADINAQARRGETPLHCARSITCILTLLHLGADLNIQDQDGLSPYYAAIKDRRFRIALVLFEAGAELDPPDGHYGDEFRQRCLTLDIIAFYRARRHRVRRLAGDMQPEDHMQVQAEAGNALLRFLAGEDIYSETHLPTDLNVMIVSFLLSPEAAANLQRNPTRLQVAKARLRRWIP